MVQENHVDHGITTGAHTDIASMPGGLIPHFNLGAHATSIRPVIMPKLRFGSLGDRFEREADRIADSVVTRLVSRSAPSIRPPSQTTRKETLGNEADELAEPNPQLEQTPHASVRQYTTLSGSPREAAPKQPPAILQRTVDAGGAKKMESTAAEQIAPLSVESASGTAARSTESPMPATTGLETQLDRTAGSGRVLPGELREQIEEEIGHDISGARIHTDETAAGMARSVNARAFTYGSDIYFASGEFNPTTSEGQRLLVHELVHVVQQEGAGLSIQRQGDETDQPTDGTRGDDGILRTPLKVPVRPADWNNSDEFMLSVIAEAFHLTIDQARDYQRHHKIPWTKPWSGPAKGETEHTVLVPVSWLKQGSTYKPPTLTDDERRKRINGRIAKLPPDLKEKLDQQGLPKAGSLDDYEKMLSDLEALAPLLNDIDYDQLIDTDGESTRKGPAARSIGVVSKADGTKMFEKGTGTGRILGVLPFDEHLIIVQQGEEWDRVLRSNGTIGFVRTADLATDIPEPGAKLYIVKSDDTLEKIAATHPSVSKENAGEDTKLVARLTQFINQHVGSPGLKLEGDVPLLVPGAHLWIPSREFVEQLRKDPSIWESIGQAFDHALEIATGVVAFVAGVLHGAAESLWDLIKGVADLFKLVWDLFMKTIGGTIVADTIGFVTEIYVLLKDPEKIKKLLELGLQRFLDKWNAPDTFSRWHFRGWLIGYIAMEVITAFFTAGAVAAVKSVGLGIVASEFIAQFPKLERAVEAAQEIKNLGRISEEIKDAEKLAKGAEEAKNAEKLAKGAEETKNTKLTEAEKEADKAAADAIESPERSGEVSKDTEPKASSLDGNQSQLNLGKESSAESSFAAKQLPKINGKTPINGKKYAGKVHPSGVRYTDQGFPIFKPYAVAEVKITGLTGGYGHDAALANKAVGLKKTPADYVWHHVEDGTTMQLIPKKIHNAARHTGGAAIIRNGGFDK